MTSETTERNPLVEMITIAAPTIVTMTSYTVMQFIDALMVSRIPVEDATEASPYVAAQGNGGIVAWLGASFVLGTTGVVNSFVSQNLGAGKPERGAAYGWAGIWISLAWGLVLAAMIPLLPFLFALMGHSDRVVELETAYAQIMIAGMGFVLASRALSHYFFGMHRPMIVMVSAVTAQLVNVFFNALLIFGENGPPETWPFASVIRDTAGFLGIPALGVAGAALGTVIGAVVEFVIPFIIFVGPKMNRAFATRAGWKPGLSVYKDILRVGWPAGAMFLNDLICWGYLLSVLIGKAGEAAGENEVVHNTAGWIGLRYMHLSFMPAVGMSIAVQAMVGRCMGEQRPDLAAKRVWLGLGVACAYMGLCALLFVLFREPLIRLFAEGDPKLTADAIEEVVRVGAMVMIAAAVFQVFDAIAIVLSAALRGAGDTVWPGAVVVGGSFAFIIGGGHLMIALFPQWGSAGPWASTALFIVAVGSALFARFLGGKWRTMSLVEHPGPPGPSPAGESRLAERV